MPRGQRKPKPDEHVRRRWLIPDARPGTGFLTSAGKFVNGEIPANPGIVPALRAMGFDPVVCTEDDLRPDPLLTEQERAERAAANRMLGIEPLENGKTRLQT